MVTARLKIWLWIQAQMMHCNRLALPIVITRRGDKDAGTVILRLSHLDGSCEIFSQVRDADGEQAWMRGVGDGGAVPDADADAYIVRQASYDPDLWVLEIEDPKGLYELDGKIV